MCRRLSSCFFWARYCSPLTCAVEVKATLEELRESRIPLAWRDGCVDLLLPLNTCRNNSKYLPWKCEHERHTYEKCLYDEFADLNNVSLSLTASLHATSRSLLTPRSTRSSSRVSLNRLTSTARLPAGFRLTTTEEQTALVSCRTISWKTTGGSLACASVGCEQR
jgi:hypothetical protein